MMDDGCRVSFELEGKPIENTLPCQMITGWIYGLELSVALNLFSSRNVLSET